jgi:plastocyanin
MRRLAPLFVIAATFAALLVIPALAADQTFEASGTSWVPTTRTVTVGDTVTWNVTSGYHSLSFSDGAPGHAEANGPWQASRTFNVTPGTYGFRCDVHEAYGMVGSVTVVAPSGTPGATATPTAGTTPSPGTTPTATSTPTGTPTATPPGPPPGFTVARVAAKRVRVTFTLAFSAPGSASVVLERAPLRGRARYRRFGTLRFAGLTTTPRTYRPKRTVEGRRLAPGRYRVKLTPRAGSGAPAVLRFRLR